MGAGMNNLDAVEVLLGSAGVILAGLLLWGLHKKLKLFTKGTITFMTVVLMLVAFESIVEHLNDLRNSESSAKSRARTSAATSFLRSWLEGREAEALELCDVDERDMVANEIRDAAHRIAMETQQPIPEQGSLPWSTLLSFDLGRYLEFNLAEWTAFSALVKTADGRYLKVKGRIEVSGGDQPVIRRFSDQIIVHRLDTRFAALEYWDRDCVFRDDRFAAELPRNSRGY
jgi:hypothetical protein